MVKRRVALEIGLTSNVSTKSTPSLAAHPALKFHKAGVPITLNTDDRGIIGIDLTHEYEQAARMGFTVDDLCGITLGSTDHVFLPASERASLRARFETETKALRQEAPTR